MIFQEKINWINLSDNLLKCYYIACKASLKFGTWLMRQVIYFKIMPSFRWLVKKLIKIVCVKLKIEIQMYILLTEIILFLLWLAGDGINIKYNPKHMMYINKLNKITLLFRIGLKDLWLSIIFCGHLG